MKVSEKEANTIDRFPVDYIFTYNDFDIEVSSKAAAVKALNRMAAAGKRSNGLSAFSDQLRWIV